LSVQSITNSRFGLALALGIGKFLPPKIGLGVSKYIGRKIAESKDDPSVKAVRANLWVVSGERLTSEELDQMIVKVFSNQARALYFLYRNFRNPAGIKKIVRTSKEFKELVDITQSRSESLMIVGVHMSNFDLVGYSAIIQGARAYSIGVSNPGGGYQWQYQMRREAGWEVVTASKSALREAEKRLQLGESVMTGIDRPIKKSKYKAMFFNRPASLPVLHIRLAVKSKVPVVIVGALMDGDGMYTMHASERIYLQTNSDRHAEIVQNAERVLKETEKFILRDPTQWMMFLPVWPEALSEVP
jgi:KDO2-lipid IV(A) lauroyltransferase